MQSYLVKKVEASISIGDFNIETAWADATPLNSFFDPWLNKAAPNTLFKALHDDTWVYFLFQVETPGRYAWVVENDKMETAHSDRVELFFRIDEKMDTYYCLEMDYLGRLLDNSARYYRKMNYDWQWPKDSLIWGAKVKGNTYWVEGQILKSTLRELKLLKNNEMDVGIFQAEYILDKESKKYIPNWYTWVVPQTEKPDFHVPSAFGKLILEY